MVPSVTFDARHDWIPDREAVEFTAFVDGRKVRCLVQLGTLEAVYGIRGPEHQAAEKAFLAHQDEIRDVAKSRILMGRLNARRELIL